MWGRQPPLDERELRIVRGMIDDHLQRVERERMVRGALRDVRVLLAVAGGLLIMALNAVELVITLNGR